MTDSAPIKTEIDIEDLIQKHSNTVYRLAYARTKNKADAEDLFQKVFLRFLKSNIQFKDDEHCKAWLIRVTINCGKNLLASMWRKKAILTEDPPEASGENNNIHWDDKSEIYYAVMDLPEKYRIVVHLFYYEDYSVKEIAQILHRKESTVKIHLYRARQLLKSKLKGEYDYV